MFEGHVCVESVLVFAGVRAVRAGELRRLPTLVALVASQVLYVLVTFPANCAEVFQRVAGTCTVQRQTNIKQNNVSTKFVRLQTLTSVFKRFV